MKEMSKVSMNRTTMHRATAYRTKLYQATACRMKMSQAKKYFALAVIFFVLASKMFSSVNWFSKTMEHTVSVSVHVNTNTGFYPYPDVEHFFIPSTSFSYLFDMRELSAITGIHFSAKTFDLTNRVVYGPTFWNCFNVGLGLTHHLLSFTNYFVEQDILLGVFFNYKRRAFYLKTDIDYFFKWSHVYDVYDSLPAFVHHSIALSSTWGWFVLEHLDFYFNLGSYLPYRYALFWSPTFMTGLQWKFNNGCAVGGEVSFQFVDLMSVTSYMNMCELRIFTRWVF